MGELASPTTRAGTQSKTRKEGTPSLCFLAECCSGPRKMPVIAEGREQNPSAQMLGWNCAFLRPPFPPLYTLLFGSEIYPGLKRNSSSNSENSLLLIVAIKLKKCTFAGSTGSALCRSGRSYCFSVTASTHCPLSSCYHARDLHSVPPAMLAWPQAC